jgi:thiol-disulfide isomerase/thioredoxin
MSFLNVTRVKHVSADRIAFLKHLAETPNHTVLKLTATWCGPCKQIAEYTRLASLRLPANVDLIECDVDESFDLSVTGADIKALDAFFFRVLTAANPGNTATGNYSN